MRHRALITGIGGQDGFYLARFLLDKGYDVWGMLQTERSHHADRLREELPGVQLLWGDLQDPMSLRRVLARAVPDEVYNLAAITFVPTSFTHPEQVASVNGLGVLRLLEATREANLETRFYQASTSEMFGRAQAPQSENTPFHPRSPYGSAKVFAHHTVVNYRETYGMFACSGICFNHESPRRDEAFVTRKVTAAVARIKAGRQQQQLRAGRQQQQLNLGTPWAVRDWGYAGDYVRAMWTMLQQDTPDDYVIATGVGHSVWDLVQFAFKDADLDPEEHVHWNTSARPAEVEELIGDARKAQAMLGWRPQVSFRDLVTMMVTNDLAKEGVFARG